MPAENRSPATELRRDIALIPPSRYTVGFVYALGIVFGVIFVYLYVNSTDGLAPDKARAQLPGLLLMLGMMALALGGIRFALHRRALTLTDSELIVRAGFYGRAIPRSSLRLEAAVEFSLAGRNEFAPRWRTNGIGLPGFRAGWFRLRNGEKALLFLTDPFHVVYLPTTAGYALLLSTTGLLAALHEPPFATGAVTSASTP